MFYPSEMQSTASSLFSAYASLAASMMLVRSVANDIIPTPVRSYLQSAIHYLFTTNLITIVIHEQCGIRQNQVYEAAEIYLRTKISPSTERFKVSKTHRQKNLSISIEKGEEIRDRYKNFDLKWKFVSVEPQNAYGREKRFFELNFNKKFKQIVVEEYLPFVLAKAKEIKDSEKVVRLYTRDFSSPYADEDGSGGAWGSIDLEHRANFETLAMDPEIKKMIIDDLDRFVRRKDYYKKVGKAWKRGYLLYGPPGTGKSSMIAAMANYLKFDIYDLELTSLYSNSELRRIMLSTTNKSIIVIEDIDCSKEMQDRYLGYGSSDSKLTLSGLLNFIDGLWSSCGEERIIVFTTNHKDRLDPALLRPGRMDMHIHMSYCTNPGFRLLASNYLSNIDNHRLFGEIEGLIENVQVTPAEVVDELMKSEDADIALGGVVNFLKRKKMEVEEAKEKEEKVGEVKENGATEEESNGGEVQEAKRLKLEKLITETRKKRGVRNCRNRAIKGKPKRGTR